MRVIYKSFDGLEFDTAAECQHHENTNPLFKMYNGNGLVESAREALVVVLLDHDKGADGFIRLCRHEDCTSEGIGTWCHGGVFVWDGEQWAYLDDSTIKALRNVIS